jgi:hypothetical protein
MIELNGKWLTFYNDKSYKHCLELLEYWVATLQVWPRIIKDGLELVRIVRILGRYAPVMAAICIYYGLFLETQLLPKRRVKIVKIHPSFRSQTLDDIPSPNK